jgi:hypothetical protein
MISIGIDIVQPAQKRRSWRRNMYFHDLIPTGGSSASAASELQSRLTQAVIIRRAFPVSPPIWKAQRPLLPKAVTEITCHAKGARLFLFGRRFLR